MIQYIKCVLFKVIINYPIPRSLTSPLINMNSSYLLINTEFRDQTYLFGFEFFAQVNGTINLKVKIIN